MTNEIRMPILKHEVKCRPSPSALHELNRAELAIQTAEFLSRGGQVQQIERGGTAEKYKDRTSSEIKAIKRKFNDGAM
jgi:hypothetical protein